MLRSSPSHATYNLQHALEVLTEVSTLIPYKAFAQTQSQCKFTSEIKQAPQIGCSKSHENFLSKLLRSAVVIYIYTYCKNAQFVSAKNPGRDIFEWRAIFWLTFFGGFPAWLCGFYGFCGFCEGLWLLLYLALPIYLSNLSNLSI
jgi:hypothetical protein